MPRKPRGSLATVPYHALVEALRTQTTAAIAQHYGVHISTVQYWRKKLDLPLVRPGGRRGPRLDEVLLAWLTAHPTGATVQELCHALGKTSVPLYQTLWRLERQGRVRRTLEQRPGTWQGHNRWWALPDAGS